MRVLLAFDKFKDALGAGEACAVAARALAEARPDASCELCPLADGGDGFEGILGHALGAERVPVEVTGPRGRRQQAFISLVPAGVFPEGAKAQVPLLESLPSASAVAIVEMAQASGLASLAPQERDPFLTSSYGTGQLIRAAAELGARAVILGIGGSATNDLGLGALTALGYEVRSETGKLIRPAVPASWPQIASIAGALFPSIPPIAIASDVENPLLGTEGATAAFGPQKGLPPARIPELEAGVARMSHLLCDATGADPRLAMEPGAGAAGGIAFALCAAARAQRVPGFAFLAACLRLDQRIAAADVVITGEGRFDATSLRGKGPGSLATRAAALGCQVHVFAGQVAVDAPAGVHLHSLSSGADLPPSPELLAETPERLARAIGQVFHVSLT